MSHALFSASREAHTLGTQGHDINRRASFSVSGQEKTIERLPDKVLLNIFLYLSHKDLCRLACTCKKWRSVAYDSKLWSRVSLRPEYSSLSVNNPDALLHLIATRFGNGLRYVELPSELITAPILHELSNKCPNLRYMTLDFSTAMQLHDFNDLNTFPCNLKSLAICLSEVIFLEGFMRRVYQSLGTLEVLHLIGTFELGDGAEEETYEVINISKIRSHTPNLRVVNLYGITFIDDSHVDLLSSNCIHLEVLSLNFCLRVKGVSFKTLIQRCKKLKSLLLQHCGLEDKYIREVAWEHSRIHELDMASTELQEETLADMLCRMNGFTYLMLAYCEFFTDQIMDALMLKGKLDRLRALDISHTVGLSETKIFEFIKRYGHNLQGLAMAGKPKLAEQFFLNVIPFMRSMRVLVIGTPNGWFLRLTTKVHIDQIMIALGHSCPRLERLEIQWDPDTLRSGDNSSKFIDLLRIRCPLLKSLTLSDGEYYEMVKSNFERADRMTVVRTTTNYSTSLVSLLSNINDLLFN